MKWFRLLASLKLTLVGMVMLFIGASLTYDNQLDVTMWVLVVPLAFLALNLTAAIFTNQRINRQPGLLVFHIGLLSIIVLAAIGRLSYIDAHMELADGEAFTPDLLLETKQGPLHAGRLDKVRFIQQYYTVAYAEGMQRGLTHSTVLIPDERGQLTSEIVGDDRVLVLEGYRFYTTSNKGFSVILTWLPDQGVPVTGRVNLPSYPLYDYKQDNSWTPPGASPIKFWLQLTTGKREDAAWVLNPRNSSGVLVVSSGDQRVELQVGESTRLDGGQLRYDRLSAWMGYKVYYDPTLRWLFFVSIMAVFGMAWHYWQVMGARLIPVEAQHPRTHEKPPASGKPLSVARQGGGENAGEDV